MRNLFEQFGREGKNLGGGILRTTTLTHRKKTMGKNFFPGSMQVHQFAITMYDNYILSNSDN